MLGKHRLEAFVPTQRVTQTERLRKFARLMNELMDPLQIIGSVGSGQVGEKRALTKLRPVFLRVIKQPLHGFWLLLETVERFGATAKRNRFRSKLDRSPVTAWRHSWLNWLHR
jgi:hypothetical protein